MRSLLPYGTGIFHMFLSVPLKRLVFFNLLSIDQMEWATIPYYDFLIFVYIKTRVILKGQILRRLVFDVCLWVLCFIFVYGLTF